MPPTRPSVDVVMPFAGSPAALERALAALARLTLAPGDTATLADNRRPGGSVPTAPPGVAVVAAGQRSGSYFARNRGAEGGGNPWIVFLDADVDPEPGLLDAYFEPPPDERAAVLVGAILDQPPGERSTTAERFAHGRALMSQQRTLEREAWAYAQTANCAVRRAALDAAGGFTEHVRSGGDADLCFRLREAGWTLERRDGARVTHRNRATLKDLLAQRARVGAGAQWLDERHPGFLPRRPLARALAGSARQVARAAVAAARGDRHAGELEAVQALADAAFEIGRRFSNEIGAR